MRIAKLQLLRTPTDIKHPPNLAKNLSSSIFGVAVFAVLEVFSAFWFGELVECSTAEFSEPVDGPFSSIAEEFLQLGKSQLNRIQFGRVGWQVPQLCTGGLNRFADPCDLVAGELVRHHDVACFHNNCRASTSKFNKKKARPVLTRTKPFVLIALLGQR